MSSNFTYQKKEKLKSRKLIGQLFSTGKSFHVFPVKLIYLEIKDEIDFPLKVGVGVSSKFFKNASDRNRIKRLIREVYRLEKNILHDYLQIQNRTLILFFLFTDKSLPEYQQIKTKIPLLLQRLIIELNENNATIA